MNSEQIRKFFADYQVVLKRVEQLEAAMRTKADWDDGSFDIGMASREVKASELEAGLTPVTICMDGIAVIVNNGNAVEDLTLAQIRDIFTGEIVDWDEVK